MGDQVDEQGFFNDESFQPSEETGTSYPLERPRFVNPIGDLIWPLRPDDHYLETLRVPHNHDGESFQSEESNPPGLGSDDGTSSFDQAEITTEPDLEPRRLSSEPGAFNCFFSFLKCDGLLNASEWLEHVYFHTGVTEDIRVSIPYFCQGCGRGVFNGTWGAVYNHASGHREDISDPSRWLHCRRSLFYFLFEQRIISAEWLALALSQQDEFERELNYTLRNIGGS
ncbi:hypothetical protein FN846DRAFT_894426 [Sphaerosporella brunnea]|uniref:Uncharacterized protein n=1 Tax=Sphaerosporella brunnea TaxID=1250544 RepID=A0A5J5EK99_9PEZI|nr:hypothetical protein FN846DRAFT_894423 [Sphaerosporella brunnea]KAA8895141.1 hypothetical protein FN846DRAFT_894426 [Sphaerosporella brunnea]